MRDDDEQQKTAYNAAFARGDGYSRDWMRFTRYFEHLEGLGVEPSGTRVLDVGCGPGPLEVYLRERGYKEVEAIDYAEEGLKIAKKNAPEYGYTLGTIHELLDVYEGREFDLAFCLQVLEHIGGYQQVILDVRSLLAPGGLFVISVPWDHCKDNEWHINYFLPRDFERIAKEVDMELVVTERFAENDLQLLAILRRPS
jgi:2-polyprenyl-3-methyl-5-hydroxy-6-metoxy-1,4-benzoquinol methylase